MEPKKMSFDEKIKKLVENLPEHKPSEAKRREFIARLYKVGEERKSVPGAFLKPRWTIFSGAAGVLVTLFLVVSYYFSALYPEVTNVQGTVKIYRAAKNEWVFASTSGTKLGKNDILKTFGDGQADLVMPKVYHIRLKHDSEMRLAKSVSRAVKGELGFSLDKGRMLAYYNKNRTISRQMGIETPQALATAVGTDFMVESMPLINQTMVGVLDGTVKVSSLEAGGMRAVALGQTVVRAGEKTTVRRGETPTKPVQLPENELLSMEELYSIGVRPQVALLISTGPTRTRELLSVTPLYISSDRSGVLAEKFEPIAKEINKAIREKSKEIHEESVKRLEALIREYPNPKYDVQFLLFIGAYYKHLGEYQKAVSTFDKIIRNYHTSGLASMAQCAIGIIYEEKLSDSAKAKEAYQKVLSDYPNSPEVEEASAGLSRIK